MKAFDIAVGQPWAILPEQLQVILSIAARENESIEAVSAKLGRPLQNTYSVEVRDNVAILPIQGPIMRHANLFSSVSGATSLELVAKDFNEALNNPSINAIVLNVDSPGGAVNGVNEFSNMVHAARGKKPIVAYVSGVGASAAYWIASAADEIIADATASLGSIGVISVMQDDRQAKAQKGIQEIQIVSSQSPKKRPDITTEEGRADVQSMVNTIASVFVGTVARNRGVTDSVVVSDFGQGGLLVGADAVKAGLVDRLGSFESVIARLAGLKKRGNIMEENKAASLVITKEIIASEYPSIADAFRKEGAEFECARIKGVKEQSMAGHEALVEALMFDGKSTSADAAIQILSSEKKMRGQALANLKADAPAPIISPTLPATNGEEVKSKNDHLPLEEKCDAEWRENAELRSSFMNDKAAYIAFSKADENGQVRMMQKSQH
jgi:signal peptide peptidase SppA